MTRDELSAELREKYPIAISSWTDKMVAMLPDSAFDAESGNITIRTAYGGVEVEFPDRLVSIKVYSFGHVDIMYSSDRRFKFLNLADPDAADRISVLFDTNKI